MPEGDASRNGGAAIVRSFPAHPSALYQVRRFVREHANGVGMTDEAVSDLVLAVSEACANAVIHTASSRVRVSLRIHRDRVEVSVQDSGVFQRRVPVPELGLGAGKGIPLMMALVDEVSVREGTPARPGTLVRLVKTKRS